MKSPPLETTPPRASGRFVSQASVIQRVRAIVGGLDLDCDCRSKLDGVLQRFETLEERRQLQRLILDARHQAERISALLDFVRELDEVTSDEPDISVFDEIALLFEGIREAAVHGSDDMRAARSCRVHPPEPSS